eukprot:4723431-Pleurochrysis_carterae.AAC.1
MLEVGDLWDYILSALDSYHAEVARVPDRTGCKRIHADGDGEVTMSTRPAGIEGKGKPLTPCGDYIALILYSSQTTMASTVAARLVGA